MQELIDANSKISMLQDQMINVCPPFTFTSLYFLLTLYKFEIAMQQADNKRQEMESVIQTLTQQNSIINVC